jgi:hypothetical protein
MCQFEVVFTITKCVKIQHLTLSVNAHIQIRKCENDYE